MSTTLTTVGLIIARMLRHPVVREVLVAALAATARYVARRMQQRRE